MVKIIHDVADREMLLLAIEAYQRDIVIARDRFLNKTGDEEFAVRARKIISRSERIANRVRQWPDG